MNQTVAQDDPETPAGEDIGAQDELDTLLAQYDEGQEPTEPPAEKPSEPVVDKRVDALLARERDNDINNAIDTIMDEVSDVQIPKSMVKGYLFAKESEDPRIGKAFDNRFSDPAGWNRILKGIAQEAKKEFKDLPDKAMTNDRNAVEAAVRGASSTKAEAPEVDFKGMDRNQLNRWLRDNG